jgi:uncharacterized membrane protein
MLRLTLAALHLLALGIGLGGIWGRARGLGQRPLDLSSVRRAFAADSWWGVAAMVWRPDETTARRISVISCVQVALLLLMLVAAVSMARGYGYQPAR